MATRLDLADWVLAALNLHGGQASIIAVAKYIWDHHRLDLEGSGTLFYTWQYDMRWAATRLRRRGKLKQADDCLKGVWEIAA